MRQLEVLAHPLGVDAHARRSRRAPGPACSRAGSSSPAGSRAPPRSGRCRARARARRSRARPGRCRAGPAPGRRCAREVIGLRLCGIALEPFWPCRERLLDLAHLGALQVADLESRAARARRRPARSRSAARRGGRAARPGSKAARRRRPSRVHDRALDVGLERRVGADRARELADGEPARTPLAAAARCGRLSNAKPASFSPKVVGSACTPCVRPTQIVSRNSRARATSARVKRAARRQRALARPRAAGAPGRCRARRRTSGRSGSSGRPRRSTAATTSTKAATSWSVTRSRSFTASTSKTRALLICSRSPAGITPRSPAPRRRPARPRARPRACAARTRCGRARARVAAISGRDH